MIGLGMHASLGDRLDGLDHIRQSVAKIITTPIGSRLMRREFGSLIPELVDTPVNRTTRLLIMAATADAVIRWEPRIKPVRVSLELSGGGSQVQVELLATVKDGPSAGTTINLMVGVIR